VGRRYLRKDHRAYVPDFGVFITAEDDHGKRSHFALSRQMVLFCIERRKSWRTMQSRAGQDNIDYTAQKTLLARVDAGTIPLADFLARTHELFDAELAPLLAPKPAAAAPAPAPKPAPATV